MLSHSSDEASERGENDSDLAEEGNRTRPDAERNRDRRTGSRRAKRLKLLLILLCVIALVSVVQTYALPALLQQILLRRLADIGLPEAGLQVRNANLRGLQIANVTLDASDSARIGSLAIRYSPLSLVRGEVHEIELTGLELRLISRQGQWDLGPLARIETSVGGESDDRLPFQKVSLRSCALVLDRDDERTRIPFEGSAEQRDDGTIQFEADASAEGIAGRLTGAYDPEAASLSAQIGSKYLTIRLPLRFRKTDRGFGLELASDARIRLTLPDAKTGAAVAAPPTVFALDGRCDFGANQWEATLRLDRNKEEDLQVAFGPGLSARLRKLQIRASARRPAGGGATEFLLDARAEQSAVRGQGWEVAVKSPKFEVSPEEGMDLMRHSACRLLVDQVAFRHDESGETFAFGKDSLDPISGTCDWEKRRADLKTTWRLQPEARLKARATLELRDSGLSANVTADCEGIDLKQARETVGRFLDLSDLELAGKLAVRSRWELSKGRLRPRIDLTVKEASLKSLKYQAEAQDVDASVTLTGFDPPVTPGDQRIRIGNARLGSLKVHDGLIAFRLESNPSTVLIERTEWGWLKGRLYHYALRFDPKRPRIDFRVFADSIDFGELLKLLLGPTAGGEGTLYGMMSVSLPLKDLSGIRFGRGYLYSHPDGGWWRVGGKTAEQAKAILSNALSRAMGSGAKENRERVLAGLLGFKFTTLKAEFIEREDGLLARLTTQGESRDPDNPVHFEGLSLDFPRFEENLRKAILIESALNRAQDILKKRSGD